MEGRKKVTAVQGQGIPAAVDPNKARTASDISEETATTEATEQAAAEKQEHEQEHKDKVAEEFEAEQVADEMKEAAADEAFENLEERPSLVSTLMDQHSVDQLFENSKGEYFLDISLAVGSEGGKKERVKTHNR